MIASNAKVELETAQGKGSILEVPRDNRGDDSLYLVYTVEELRWILREMGIKVEYQEPPLVSPYSVGSGMVLSTTHNPDNETGSCVHVYGGFWDNGANSECQARGCVTQMFRRKRVHESVWASFENLPPGRHTYALGFGYMLDSGEISLSVRAAKIELVREDYDAWHKRIYQQIESGRLVEGFKMIHLDAEFLFSQQPLIAVFKYEPRIDHSYLDVVLEVEVPNMRVKHSVGFFHHIQLVQID